MPETKIASIAYAEVIWCVLENILGKKLDKQKKRFCVGIKNSQNILNLDCRVDWCNSNVVRGALKTFSPQLTFEKWGALKFYWMLMAPLI